MPTVQRPKLNRYAIEKSIKIISASVEMKNNEQRFIWIEGVQGLGIRLLQTRVGLSKAWIIQTRPKGSKTPKRLTLSQGFDLTEEALANAEKEAQVLKSLVLGRELKNENARTGLELNKQTTLDIRQQKLKVHYERYIDSSRENWGNRHLKDHYDLAQVPGGQLKKRGKTKTNVRTAGPLYELLQLKPQDLTKIILIDWLQRESKTRKGRVALAFRVLGAFVRWMQEDDDTKGLVALDIFGSRGVKRHVPKLQPKRRYLTEDQLKPWIKAVFETANFVSARAISLLLLTGARLNELLELKWSDVDLQYKKWTLKDKNSGTRLLPITDFCFRILIELKFYNEKKSIRSTRNGLVTRNPSPFVFFSDRSSIGRITDLSSTFSRANVLSAVGKLSAHDLRRTFCTFSEEKGVPRGAAAQFQGHRPSGTVEKHYTQRSIDALRRQIQPYENWLVNQSGLDQLINASSMCCELPMPENVGHDIGAEFASWLV
jgi:integrase